MKTLANYVSNESDLVTPEEDNDNSNGHGHTPEQHGDCFLGCHQWAQAAQATLDDREPAILCALSCLIGRTEMMHCPKQLHSSAQSNKKICGWVWSIMFYHFIEFGVLPQTVEHPLEASGEKSEVTVKIYGKTHKDACSQIECPLFCFSDFRITPPLSETAR